jgi:hypothetical protein
VNGGTIEGVAENQGYLAGLKSDGTYIYWSDRTTRDIKRLPIGTTGSGIVVFGNGRAVLRPSAIGVDASNIYWFDEVLRRTFKALKTPPADPETAEFTPLSPEVQYSSPVLAVDAASVYFAQGEAAKYAPVDGSGASTELSYPGSSGTAVAIDATHVYYTT